MDQKTPHKDGYHFAGPNPGEFFAVAPGMRFRKPDGTVVVVPMPAKEPKKD